MAYSQPPFFWSSIGTVGYEISHVAVDNWWRTAGLVYEPRFYYVIPTDPSTRKFSWDTQWAGYTHYIESQGWYSVLGWSSVPDPNGGAHNVCIPTYVHEKGTYIFNYESIGGGLGAWVLRQYIEGGGGYIVARFDSTVTDLFGGGNLRRCSGTLTMNTEVFHKGSANDPRSIWPAGFGNDAFGSTEEQVYEMEHGVKLASYYDTCEHAWAVVTPPEGTLPEAEPFGENGEYKWTDPTDPYGSYQGAVWDPVGEEWTLDPEADVDLGPAEWYLSEIRDLVAIMQPDVKGILTDTSPLHTDLVNILDALNTMTNSGGGTVNVYPQVNVNVEPPEVNITNGPVNVSVTNPVSIVVTNIPGGTNAVDLGALTNVLSGAGGTGEVSTITGDDVAAVSNLVTGVAGTNAALVAEGQAMRSAWDGLTSGVGGYVSSLRDGWMVNVGTDDQPWALEIPLTWITYRGAALFSANYTVSVAPSSYPWLVTLFRGMSLLGVLYIGVRMGLKLVGWGLAS